MLKKLFLTLVSFLWWSSPLYGAEPIQSVQAQFTQEKQMAILAKPLISTGQFFFQAPNSLRWEYFTPLHSVLLQDNGRVRKYVKKDSVFVEEHSMGLTAMQMVLQEITGWLDGEITDTETFHTKQLEKDRIVLTPREEGFQKIISRIELELEGQSGLMKSVTIYENEGSSTTMQFSESRLNAAIPKILFERP